MKHNLLKSVILSVILLMGVSNAWCASSIKSANIKYWDGNEDAWFNDLGTPKDLGDITDLYINEFWVKVGDDNVCKHTCMYYGFNSNVGPSNKAGDYNIENPQDWDVKEKYFSAENTGIHIAGNSGCNIFGANTLYVKFIAHGNNDCGELHSSVYQIKFNYYPDLWVAGNNWGLGDWNCWDEPYKMTRNGSVYTKVIKDVTAEPHQFKITTKNWGKSYGYDQVNNISYDINNCTVTKGNDGNIVFTPKAKGYVKITYDAATGDVEINCTPPETLTYTVTTPPTEKCYIIGDWDNWDETKYREMEKIGENTFRITIQNTAKALEYKYCCAKSWGFQELNENYSATNNRTYSANDVVIHWSLQTIYLKPGIWTENSPRFEVNWWMEGEPHNGWIDLVKSSDCDDYYVAQIPLYKAKFKFCRTNPNPNNFDDKWHTIDNLSVTNNNNLFTITDWNNGSWSSSTQTFENVKQAGGTMTVSSNTVKLGEAVTITLTTNPGYTNNSTITIGSDVINLQEGTSTYTICGPTTINAQWTENKHDVIVSYKCGNKTIEDNTTHSVSEIKASDITAPVIDGYTFDGWTLGDGIVNRTGNETSNPITISTYPSGTYTLTANYIEKSWYISGTKGNGSPFTGWGAEGTLMKKKPGQSANIYYCIIEVNTIASEDSHFEFQVYNNKNSQYYGYNYYWITKENNSTAVYTNNPQNMKFRPYVTGTYEFKLDVSGSDPVLTVSWPEVNELRFYSERTGGILTDVYKWENTNTDTWTKTVYLNASTTYYFKVLEESNYLGNTGTMVKNGTSVHSGGWEMTNVPENCGITTDLAGEYLFTFNTNTNKLTVQYPVSVTLGKSTFGPYGISYNGQSYFSKDNADVTIGVTKGAVIEFIEGQPYSDLYTGHIMQSEPEAAKNRANPLDYTKPFTVTEDVRFDPNYVTNVTQVAYLGVPKNKTFTVNEEEKPFWTKEGNNGNLIWTRDGYGTMYIIENVHNGTQIFEANNVIYYQFTIPEGVNGIQFQHKPLTNQTAEPNRQADRCQTPWIDYPVLSNNINCYTLSHFDKYLYENDVQKEKYIGYWDALPAKVGDYRLLYVDQVVEKGTGNDSWKTVISRTYEHPSDVVRKSNTDSRDVVSLHVFTKHENPEVILQQYQTVDGVQQWVDIEAHMVNGPLETEPGMAMLPGRKKAAEGSDCDDFVYDDGIDIIKNNGIDAGCGVWDFTIVQTPSSKATLDLTEAGLKRYEGKYYIRTSSADGKWDNFRIPANEIYLSHYASENFRLDNPDFVENEYFTHYFCKYVDKTKTENVKFIIANEHGIAISKEFTKDVFTSEAGDLLGLNANVRFSWNQITNTCKRAYIAGSYDGYNEFLVVKHENNGNVTTQPNTSGKDGYFNDNTNWLYYADVLAKPEARVQVVAKYNTEYQYFMGEGSGENQYEQLIGGDATNDQTSYPIRIMYEFPEHRFVVAYLPNEDIKGDVAIETPVMLIRKNHEEANQITFNDNERKITAPLPAYGTITFTEDFLKANDKSIYEKCLYWISFPFDVNIKDAFGLNKYGEDWIIEYYNGEKRSKEGLTSYNTYWEYNWNEDYVLEAGKGYVLCLDLDKVLSYFLDGKNPNEEISLYFPSTETIAWGDIKQQGEKEVTLNQHPNTAKSATDHNWHVIGVPSYANTGETTQQDNTAFLYKYQAADDSYIPASSTGMTFQSMHAYMVQYAGIINWNSYIAPEAQAIAARKNNGKQEKHALRLELSQKGKYNDQTFVTLQDDNATTKFDLNTDLPKIINVGANIYSIISEEKIKLAGNVMPNNETIIPLGVVSAAAGEYTFAMPDGTDGIIVELIDYETNTRTNMTLDEYTVNLGKGTFETRFALHVKPDKTVTSVEDINTNSDGVRKFIIDGVLYMQKDGMLYDAQGKLVR